MRLSTLVRTVSRTVLAAVVACLSLASADAQVVPLDFAVEGPISAINPANQTITVQGMTVIVPADLVITGTNNITGANLSALLDANAPGRVRSIFASTTENPGYSGATLIGDGVIEQTPTGRVFRLTAASLELAENVLLGVLDSVDIANNTFVVNGVTCRMNPDQRFPSKILDAGAEPMTLTDLGTQVGTVVAITGYFLNEMQYAVTVETDFVPTNPATDTVRITRAQGRARNGNRSELNVVGVVTPFEAGTTITLTDANNGTVLGTVAVTENVDIAGQGDFRFRRTNLPSVPTRLRATSSNGGVHEVDVEIR